MLILAVVFAISPATEPSRLNFQLMTSPTYGDFAEKADSVCPARRLRYLHPADLDYIEEDYLSYLTRSKQRWIDTLANREKACTGQGASCPAQHTLAGIKGAGMLDAFVGFACSSTV
jgi:hypothetical protein